jgi:hypothetical protein
MAALSDGFQSSIRSLPGIDTPAGSALEMCAIGAAGASRAEIQAIWEASAMEPAAGTNSKPAFDLPRTVS